MKGITVLRLAAAILISLSAGAVGSFFTAPAISAGWYVLLAKPALNPPAWVFGPVWTMLFVLMGVAAFLVWNRGLGRRDVRVALALFLIQLVLNVLWSVLFFGMQIPGAALAEIFALWLAIFATVVMFGKISKAAAWLLVPYILWISFAIYLNYSIWMLN